MSKFTHIAFLISCVCLLGCAGTATSVVRTPQLWELTSHVDSDIWKKAAADVSADIPEYQISWNDSGYDNDVMNAIQSSHDQTFVCLEPQVILDHAGNMESVVPMYCTELDVLNPKQALTDAMDMAQRQKIVIQRENSAAFRAQVLAQSTPEHPVCYAVYPALFANQEFELSLQLEEAYLIACAERIMPDNTDTWRNRISAHLASWLNVEAALISTQNSFIARAFKKIAQDNTKEGMIYGQAIEAYTEYIAQKTRQTEITSLSALKNSDEANLLLLSRQTATRLSHVVTLAETMDGKRLEAIIRALTPKTGWTAKMIEYRQWLQIKVCRTSIIVPDISSSLVSACMPWLESSLSDIDEFEMVLLLIEHGIYGSKQDEPVIADDVFLWLQNIPKTEPLLPVLREFALRIQSHDRLTDAQRAILKTISQ